jgi:MFS family permease
MVTDSSGIRSRLVLPVLAYGALLVAALQIMVVPIVRDIGVSLGASTSAVNWVVTANLLAAAVFTPLLGRLGDLRDRRPVLIGVLAVVLVGSLLAATTHDLALLLIGRALQGVSYAIFPLALGVLRDELPPRRLTGAMAVVSGMLSAGGGLALVATGLLTANGGDYRRVFWLASVLSAIGLIGAWLVIPARRSSAQGRVDWVGGMILGAALVLLLIPLSQGNRWGWGSAPVIGLLTGSLIASTVFVLTERRLSRPLVSMRMLTRQPIVVANIAGVFLGASMFIGFQGATAFVETPSSIAGYGFGSTVLAASVVYLLPGALAGVVMSPLAGKLVARSGAKATLVTAMVLAAAGFAFLAVLHGFSWQIITGVFAVLTGVTFGYAALPALLVEHVAPTETGIANSVNSIARTVGSSLASALVVILLTSNLIPGRAPALPQQSQYAITFAVGAIGAGIAAIAVMFGLPAVYATPTTQRAEGDIIRSAAGTDPSKSMDITEAASRIHGRKRRRMRRRRTGDDPGIPPTYTTRTRV